MGRAAAREEFWYLLTDIERSALSSLGRFTVFPPGATMCVEGEPATHVFVVETGWVKVLSVTSDGHELLLALRGYGDVVGEFAGGADGYRTATVRAIDLVRSLIVAYEKFTSFLDSHPGAGGAYRQVVTRGWRDTAAILRSRTGTSGQQRLAALLMDLALRHGFQAPDAVEIEMPLTQEELASLAGASRATVTRAFSDWRHRGLIRTGQRHIAIINLDKLSKIANPIGRSGQAPLRQPPSSSPLRIRCISSRQLRDVPTRIAPDRSRESLISTDDPSKATSTQASES